MAAPAGTSSPRSTSRTSKNFGRDEHFGREDRYERARESLDVVRSLWDSWASDAFLQDKSTGRYLDPDRVRLTNHRGKHFAVKGPLNVARTPQGQPVVFMAGQSEAGKELAAYGGEGLFGTASNKAEAQAEYADIKGRMKKYGRPTDALRILPALSVFVGRTAAEADALFDELQALISPALAVSYLSKVTGVDLTGLPIDGPMPKRQGESLGGTAIGRSVLDMAAREGLSVRATYERVLPTHGGNMVKGDPVQVADMMEDWYRNKACDGFMLSMPVEPRSLRDFVELVVPELQRRGLRPRGYRGTTLRDNMGLAHPADPFLRVPRPAEAQTLRAAQQQRSPDRAAGLEIDVALEGEAPAAIDGENILGLLEKQSAQQRAAAWPDGGGERIRQLHQRAGQDVGDDEVVGLERLQLVMAQADGMDEPAEIADPVQRGILARDLDGLGIVVAADHRSLPQLGHGDRQNAAAAADIDGVGRLGAIERRQQLQAAARRGMRAGAERHAGIDPSGSRPVGMLAGVVRGMDPEGADRERLERALVLGDPIPVGQLLPVPVGADRRRDHGLVAFAEDLYAPRPVARDLAAGDHEALLGEMLQRLLARGAVGCGHFQPGRPDAHAASMKLSKTFLGPAFSNSMSSLLPSTATMRP